MNIGELLGKGAYGCVFEYCKAGSKKGAVKFNIANKKKRDVERFVNNILELDILRKSRGVPFLVQLSKIIGVEEVAQHPRVKELAVDLVQFHFVFSKADSSLDKFLDSYFDSNRRSLLFGRPEEYLSDVTSIFHQISLGIKFLHLNNIIHGDMKVDNILIRRNENGVLTASITDFGLSQYKSSATTLVENQFPLPLQYKSPELLLRKSYGKGIDIWGLGLIMYECISGEILFREGCSNAELDFVSKEDGDLWLISLFVMKGLVRNLKPQKPIVEKYVLKIFRENLPDDIDNIRGLQRAFDTRSSGIIEYRAREFPKSHQRAAIENYDWNPESMTNIIERALTFLQNERPSIDEILEDKFFDHPRFKDIAKNFNSMFLRKINVPETTEMGMIPGQHRTEAMKLMRRLAPQFSIRTICHAVQMFDRVYYLGKKDRDNYIDVVFGCIFLALKLTNFPYPNFKKIFEFEEIEDIDSLMLFVESFEVSYIRLKAVNWKVYECTIYETLDDYFTKDDIKSPNMSQVILEYILAENCREPWRSTVSAFTERFVSLFKLDSYPDIFDKIVTDPSVYKF